MKMNRKGKSKSRQKFKKKPSIYWFIKLKQNQIMQKGQEKFTKSQIHKKNNQIKITKICKINQKQT